MRLGMRVDSQAWISSTMGAVPCGYGLLLPIPHSSGFARRPAERAHERPFFATAVTKTARNRNMVVSDALRVFSCLEQFEALAGRNAQTAYQKMDRE